MNAKGLYTLSFIEGGVVMAAELCAAKLLAPYFGTSIDVWASTLAITLGGLTAGYFIGGLLTTKYKDRLKNVLRTVLLGASLLLILVSFYSDGVMHLGLSFGLGVGASFSLLLILFPILLFLGCTSPLLIEILSKENPGRVAGNIYSISTLGGILVTYLVGFYFLSNVGIKFTLIFFGVLLALSTLLILRTSNATSTVASLVGLFICAALTGFSSTEYNPSFKVLHESDGVLGNIKIIEHTSEDFSNTPKLGRGMVVNNTLQTYMDVEGPGISLWEWAHIIPTIAGVKPKNAKTLLLGLGGGTVYKQLELLEHDIQVVEIDQRIKDLAIEYFKIDPNLNVSVTDARHFMKRTEDKYDVIIYDAFLSESPPEHLLTKEGLADAMNILNEDGFLIVNFYGFLTGEKGYAARSVAKTILESGYVLHLIPTPGQEDYRNLLFVIGKTRLPNYHLSTYSEPEREQVRNWGKGIIYGNQIDVFDAEILTDQKPSLSKLYKEAAKSWRTGYNEIYTKKLFK